MLERADRVRMVTERLHHRDQIEAERERVTTHRTSFVE
jgi:hypothetical protein